MKISLKSTAVALAIAAAFGGANATDLVTNVPSASVDTVSALDIATWSSSLLNSVSTDVATPGYTGTARTAVYQSPTGLDFYYQFVNNATSVNGISRLTGYDFSSLGDSVLSVFQTNAAMDIFTVGTKASGRADSSDLGVVGFSFNYGDNTKVTPGTTSYTQIIRTNASNYSAGNFGILNGYASNAVAFAPVTAVPEPETFAMMLAGLGMVGTIIRRRRNSQA